MFIFVAMVQAVTSVPPEKIDLTIRQPCEAQQSNADEVIVCGHRTGSSGRYRINEAPARPAEIPAAAIQLADGVSASAETESVEIGGVQSNRAMLRVKIKF